MGRSPAFGGPGSGKSPGHDLQRCSLGNEIGFRCREFPSPPRDEAETRAEPPPGLSPELELADDPQSFTWAHIRHDRIGLNRTGLTLRWLPLFLPEFVYKSYQPKRVELRQEEKSICFTKRKLQHVNERNHNKHSRELI